MSVNTQVQALQPGGQDPTITLDLQNMARIPATVLDEGKETLRRIYHAAGIRVEWNTTGAHFTVIIRSPPHPEALRNSRSALGYAPGSSTERGRLAVVLADRTKATASGLSVPHHVVLGMTMAHEVGHLLLPYNAHARTGIMRDDWTPSDYQRARLGILLFTEQEGRLMREALAAVRLQTPSAPSR